MLDSQPWKCVEAVPAILFSLERGDLGERGARDGSVKPQRRVRRLSIHTAEGRASAIESGRIWLTDGDAVSLQFDLPERIDLRPLVGSRLRVTLCNEPLLFGPMGQLLTIADDQGRVKLVAHFGTADGEAHSLGTMNVRVALSQRSRGPIVFGTSQLQCAVHVGEHVAVRDANGEFIMHFVARTAAGYAAYVIVDRSLWRDS